MPILPPLRLPASLTLPFSQESDDDDDVCLNGAEVSLNLTADEPQTPGVDNGLLPAPTTSVCPVSAARKPQGLTVIIRGAQAATMKDWGSMQLAGQGAAGRKASTTFKLQPGPQGQAALAMLQRPATVMDSIAAQLGYVPVIGVPLLRHLPQEVSV
jgi:hypothetical protein